MPPGDSLPSLLGGDEHWRRLDVRMLLVHPVQEAVRFLPALAVVFVTGRNSGRSGWWDWAILALVVVLGMSRWFTTRYRIWDGQIELRKGLLFRSLLTTPADRIRTVDVTAPMWHRALGLARVQIGTASSGPAAPPIVLDALAAPVAEQLRGELLHRRTAATALGREEVAAGMSGAGGPEASDGPGSSRAAAGARGATVDPDDSRPAIADLLTLSPSWVRFAPFTTSGLVSALAIWGFSAQFLEDLAPSAVETFDAVAALGVGLGLAVALVSAAVVMSLLAVTAYVLSFWDYELTRHAGGTLQVRRGLLTVRATSLEEARLRGVEVGEPLGLRIAGASRLFAVTTGLGRMGQQDSSWLTPPAPAAVVAATAVAVIGDAEAITGSLRPHGPAARRRRYLRALVPSAVLAAAVVGLERWLDLPVGFVVLGVLPLLAAPWLARDRYAALGHLLTDRHVVTRSGSLTRRRDVVDRRGVIGVVVKESWFQRRAGLATLTVTTAAGHQGYLVVDVPLVRAEELVGLLLPGAASGFAGQQGQA